MTLRLGLRPRLILDAPGTSEALAGKFREIQSIYSVTATDSYIVVTIPVNRQHFWSPQLQVELDDREGSVRISGLITPMPAVWTLFAGIYAVILAAGFFGLMYGLAQLQIKQPPMGLWSIPIALALLGCVYAAALIGQRIGREQTEELVNFLNKITGGGSDSVPVIAHR